MLTSFLNNCYKRGTPLKTKLTAAKWDIGSEATYVDGLNLYFGKFHVLRQPPQSILRPKTKKSPDTVMVLYEGLLRAF